MDLFLRDDLRGLRLFRLKRCLLSIRIKVIRKIESTTPARPFIFCMSDDLVVWPPLLQKGGETFVPQTPLVDGNGGRGSEYIQSEKMVNRTTRYIIQFLSAFRNKDDNKIDVLHYVFRNFIQCSLAYLIFLQPFVIV